VIHPIRAWNNFFFRPTSARPLGAIRILFGLLALINLAFCSVDLDYWYTDSGLFRGDESWVIAGPYQFSPLHFFQDPTAIRIAFLLTATAAFFLTVGWRTKLMSILFYMGMLSIHNRNLASSSGADVLLLTFAFNLMLCPCGAAYSVDAWLESRKRGTLAEPLIIPWGLRLIQIQIFVVYVCAAILKTGGALWLNGTALHYVLNNTEVRRLDVSFLTQYPVLINLMTYSALAMEFSLAFLIWFRAARPLVLFVGLMLHAGILVTINIPIFGELMWVGYLAFLTPPEFDALLRAVDVRRLFQRSRAKLEAAVESLPEVAPSASPAYRPASIIVRLDGASSLAGPHRIDASAARPMEELAIQYADNSR
jgi:Vitamin K-dependent gamma-carboxylase